MPPSAAKGDSPDFSKELIEQGVPIKESKVLTQFCHVQCGTVCQQNRADVLEILRALRIVHQRLELEADQSLRTYDAQFAESGPESRCCIQETARNRAARVQEIDTFVTACVIRRIRAAVQAAVPEPNKRRVDLVGLFRFRQQIDVLGCAHHFVRCERQSADQREASADGTQRRGDFRDLFAEARYGHDPFYPRTIVQRCVEVGETRVITTKGLFGGETIAEALPGRDRDAGAAYNPPRPIVLHPRQSACCPEPGAATMQAQT